MLFSLVPLISLFLKERALLVNELNAQVVYRHLHCSEQLLAENVIEMEKYWQVG